MGITIIIIIIISCSTYLQRRGIGQINSIGFFNILITKNGVKYINIFSIWR